MQNKRENQQDTVRYPTRFARPLHAALTRLAKEHKRSFHSEVMWALERYVEEQRRASEADSERNPRPNR